MTGRDAAVDEGVQAGERIDSLDVLRGMALLGILVMNVQGFAMVTAAYVNPTYAGPIGPAEWWVWSLGQVAVAGKFLAIFSALFGAGLLLMAERAEAAGVAPWRRHRRRMAVLALIGLAHAYLIWFGDILFTLALVGLLAFVFRRWSPPRLLRAAAWLYAIPVLWALLMTWLMHAMPEAAYRDLVASVWQLSAEQLSAEQDAYRGGWRAQMAQRVPDVLQMHLLVVPLEEGWRILAMMLAGMAAYRSGLLTGAWSTARYRRAALLGAGLGLPLAAAGQLFHHATAWEMRTSLYLGGLFNHVATPLVAMAWVCALIWLLKRGAWPGLMQRLRCLGRGALTGYLLTSLLCTALFYGHGLGLFGRLDRVEQLLVVAMVWALLLGLAPLWFRHFRMGPVEWLWRWGTYGRRAPLRR